MKIFIRNFGCSSNIADGEILAGCLAEAGFPLTTSEEEAELLIYNTCAVKSPTENHIIDALKHIPNNKKIVVTGCLPMISFDRLCREVNFQGAVGPAAGNEIVDVVKRVFAGEKVMDLALVNRKPLLSLPRHKSNPVVSIVPINYGCLGSCTYCCVVFARGHLRSYKIAELIERVQNEYNSGIREFWITSQDTAAYGRDLGSNLSELLEKLNVLSGDFRIRVGMMTPNLVNAIEKQLIKAFNGPKIFKFLHLPAQSGDDNVLHQMGRRYTVADFKGIVDDFRSKYPYLTLATDVIVGFPGETTEAFERTLKLLENISPDVINVSKFFARPKTIAARIKEGLVEQKEIKRRSAITAQLAKRISTKRNQRWVGWTGDILIDERGKVEGSWVGRNFTYKPIVIKNKNDLLGKTLNIKIVKTAATYLEGIIVKK